ncbi:hypothetical protein Pgin02_01805 [Porphyromonas gingivalis]
MPSFTMNYEINMENFSTMKVFAIARIEKTIHFCAPRYCGQNFLIYFNYDWICIQAI